jgi:hypothetical protein
MPVSRMVRVTCPAGAARQVIVTAPPLRYGKGVPQAEQAPLDIPCRGHMTGDRHGGLGGRLHADAPLAPLGPMLPPGEWGPKGPALFPGQTHRQREAAQLGAVEVKQVGRRAIGLQEKAVAVGDEGRLGDPSAQLLGALLDLTRCLLALGELRMHGASRFDGGGQLFYGLAEGGRHRRHPLPAPREGGKLSVEAGHVGGSSCGGGREGG